MGSLFAPVVPVQEFMSYLVEKDREVSQIDTAANDLDRVLTFSRPCDRILLEHQIRSYGRGDRAVAWRHKSADSHPADACRRSARLNLEERAAQLPPWTALLRSPATPCDNRTS